MLPKNHYLRILSTIFLRLLDLNRVYNYEMMMRFSFFFPFFYKFPKRFNEVVQRTNWARMSNL